MTYEAGTIQLYNLIKTKLCPTKYEPLSRLCALCNVRHGRTYNVGIPVIIAAKFAN